MLGSNRPCTNAAEQCAELDVGKAALSRRELAWSLNGIESMENEALVNMQLAIEDHPILWSLAIFVFIVGATSLGLYIKKLNRFTYGEAMLAAMGLKKFQRDWKINVGTAVVFVVPLVLMYFVISDHHAT